MILKILKIILKNFAVVFATKKTGRPALCCSLWRPVDGWGMIRAIMMMADEAVQRLKSCLGGHVPLVSKS